MAIFTALMPTPKQQFFGPLGLPLIGGKIFTYAAGTTTPKATYTDKAGTTPQTNPVILNTRGEPNQAIRWAGAYRVVVQDALGNIIYTVDDFESPADISTAAGAGLIGFDYAQIYPANSLGLWLQNLALGAGSGFIGFVQNATGAVVRNLLNRGRDWVTVFDFMTTDQINDVVSRGGGLDTTAAIQAAINYAASKRKRLIFPAGLYKITPATPFDDEDTSYITLAAFIMASHMHVEGEEGAELRIADGVSTDAVPQSMGVFCTNGTLSNVSIKGLTFDMNGANNPISPLRPATYRLYNQSPILVSGTPAGVAAKIDDMEVLYNTFKNNPGVCNICVAQSNVPGTVLGKRWKINFNLFINNGLDTIDHTGVFAWADDVEAIGNVFDNANKYAQVGRTGGNTCYEIHGSNHRVIGNLFKNYIRGIWVSSNLTAAETRDAIIANNQFETHFYGVDFFRTTATLSQPRNTIVANNTVRFDSYTFAAPVPQQRSAFQVASEYAQDGVLFIGNNVVSTDTVVGAAVLTITPQTVAGQAHKNIVCKSNTARGFVNFILMRTNATNGLGYVSIEDNNWIEPIPTAVFATPIGIFVDPVSPISTLSIKNNNMIDERGVPLAQYGTYIQAGTITDLFYTGGMCKGLTQAEYIEAGALTANRSGVFEIVNFTPTFYGGGVAFTIVDGTRQARYRINGKQITYQFRYTVGGGDTVPGGVLEVSIPYAAGAGGSTWFGNWRIYDDATGKFVLGELTIDGTGTRASFARDGTTNITTLLPNPINAPDVIGGQITYDRT